MTIKHILLPLDGDASGTAVATWALEYAKLLGAHVSVGYEDGLGPLYFTPDAVPLPAYGLFYEHMQKLREDRHVLARQQFDQAVAQTKLPIVSGPTCTTGSAMWVDGLGSNAKMSLESRAQLADLILVAAPGNRLSSSAWNIVDDILFKQARPALVVPHEAKPSHFARPIIAWNGSAEAARAVRHALDLLGLATQITVVQIGKIRPGRLPVEQLMDFLGWHCLEATLNRVDASDSPDDHAILKEANRVGADGVVMGCYTHSRTRELIFGGVTEFMLRHSDLPMLMAH